MTILETFLYDPTTDFIGKKVTYEDPLCPRFLSLIDLLTSILEEEDEPKYPRNTRGSLGICAQQAPRPVAWRVCPAFR